MKSFTHINAQSVEDAVTLLKDYRGKAKLMAGGTDLLGILKDNILPVYPEVIINLKTIRGLDSIKEDAKGLKIGALARLKDIAESATVQKSYKLLAEAAEAVATPQIRNMGTIAGNLCQDVRCWYYRYPHQIGGRILCYLKGGTSCYALTGENQYNSIFGASRAAHPSCSAECPGNMDIPAYLCKVREGDLRGAAKILLAANPMPSITGRVCPHACEADCHRGDFDEPVSIRSIERFMGDYILENVNKLIRPPRADTGKRVAIVGSGPAGLAAAYYLRMAGHRITVFDRMGKAGGMLAYGIPAYRLPKDIVARVVKMIENAGVDFKLSVDVGKDVTLEDLRKRFDSIFIASGAWEPLSIGLRGEELTKSGLEFLRNINGAVEEVAGKRIVVIGGGNVAVDAGITAKRLGAKEVILACVESREQMPALEGEIQQALEEGVTVMPSRGPRRVLKSDGKVKGIELIRCTSVFDNEGNFAPTFDAAVKERVEADQIILAVGQRADLAFIDPAWSLDIKRGLVVVDKETQGTSIPGIFAGGDVASGPATVSEAIAAGRRAGWAIDLYLKGAREHAAGRYKKTVDPFLKFNPQWLKMSRTETQMLPIATRSIDAEDVRGLGREGVEREANRCLNCGCVSVNASDIAVVLLAIDAKIKIAGPRGMRTIPIQDFFGTARNVLEADEMVVEIRVPRPPVKARQAFLKFRLRKAVDFPIVSVASLMTVEGGVCKDVRIALGAVAPTPIRATKTEEALRGKAIDEVTAEGAAEAAVVGALPLDKNSYKVEITKTLVKRAILS